MFLLACIPFLVLGVLFLVLKRSPADFHLMGSDEMDYWIESATIMKRGLLAQNTGYFGYGWQTHAILLNFGGHGLFSLFPFVVFGSLTPWQQSSMMLVNAAFISVSLIFSYLSSKSIGKTLAITAILFLFTSFSIYFMSGMLEPLMFSGSIVLASLIPKLATEGSNKKHLYQWYLGFSIAWSLFRLSNIAFLLPIIFFDLVKLKRNFFSLVLKYGAIILVIIAATFLFTAPYPWGFLTRLFASDQKFLVFASHLLQNLRLFLTFGQGWKIESVLRLSYLFWTLCLVMVLITLGDKSKNHDFRFLILVQLITLFSVLVLHLCFYDVGDLRDLRVLSPVLFFSFAATIFSSASLLQKKLQIASVLGILIVSSVINLSLVKSLKTDFIDPFFDNRRTIDLFKYIKYDPQAKDRWQNTAYLDVFNYVWMDFNNYDPGIGLMLPVGGDFASLKPEESGSTLKARYLITYRFNSLPSYELIASDDDVYLLGRVGD